MAGPDIARVEASQWTLVALSGLVLLFRFFLRATRTKKTLSDDYVLAVAWLCMLVSVSLRTAAISKSNGLSPVLVDPSMRAEVGKLNAIAGNLAIAGSMLSKTSFALTLLRVVMGRIRYLLWAIIVSMNLALFLSILFLLISCKPIEKSWNATLPGTCWPQYVQVRAGLFSSAYCAAMDFVLAGLAWWIIWGVQMKTREKIGVALGMSMGVFAGITAAIKCVYLAKLDFLNLFIWEAAETSVTIMAASVPMLRVFVVDKARKYSAGRSGQISLNGPNDSAQSRHRKFGRIDAERGGSGGGMGMYSGATYDPSSKDEYRGKGVGVYTTVTYETSAKHPDGHCRNSRSNSDEAILHIEMDTVKRP